MTNEIAASANTVILLTYLAISLAIARGLRESRQWRNNKLGTATSAIFLTCAIGHGLHALASFVGGWAHRHDGTMSNLAVATMLWDVLTAIVGIWYWSLRGRFPALVRGAAVFEDLRLRQAADRRLRMSEQRYRGIVETTSEGVVLIATDGTVEYSNAQFAALVGRTPREIRGIAFAELVQERDRERVLGALAAVRGRGTQRIEVELARSSPQPGLAGSHIVHAQIALTARADGDPLPESAGSPGAHRAAHARGERPRATEPAPGGAMAMVADVTERRNVEAQLRQAQRLDAIGQLAGGVAHDFNNLLTVIDGYAAILLTDLDGPARQDVTAIRDATARASALTRQLLAFSRTQAIKPQAVDVNDLVVGIEEMLRRLIREDIQIVVRADAERAVVWADRGQLEQVLINLAVNSRDAMPDGGQLTISTARTTLGPATGGTPEYREHVLLTVSDTGCGIPEHVRGMIFEPFFTTKEPGQGTGLGLSTVYGIVRQAGGQVLVDSTPGFGTDVRVYLPATSSRPGPADEGRDTGQLAGGRGTILLVEDDCEVRRLTERILLTAGYDVLTAHDGRRALDLAAGAGTLDLLITDVVMPRMNGSQLADRLRATRPGLPVLYLSAYNRGMINPTLGAFPGIDYLEKPYSPTLLTEKVSELLATARASRRDRETPRPRTLPFPNGEVPRGARHPNGGGGGPEAVRPQGSVAPGVITGTTVKADTSPFH
ncbi:response regulator [Frankia sp. CNm7]|uniref:histidine kinase n=1 Tax=Frankia nepalensis TaxID=1836974 RepID=A0A937RBI6_9ACTN|nr:PAS domain-containing sensor histidine kinase [Frankia nepalensis]MBL7499444.1 response regulator [Frankia nepalensis]MBL7511859.1 response regulator [Frankia nepalensis]MBL7524365.1 response regulator [Frankia nepalensis]MBL7629031.1 response regulator [Frankia nepalensis]